MFTILTVLFLGVALGSSNAQVVIDCQPEVNADPANCNARGCVWSPPARTVGSVGAPSCVYPDGYGYDHDGTTVIDTPLGYILPLTRKSQPSMFGIASPDVQNVYLSVEFWDKDILRLKFYDPAKSRYEVPIEISQPSSRATNTDYFVRYTSNPQFGVSVIRNSTGTTVFDTGLPGFVFSEQFLTISTQLPSANVYGFGEHVHHQLRHDLNWEVWTMFARDTGTNSPYNLYGVQPFYLNVESDGNANGVFLLNSNAMQIELQPAQALTYWTIGGILDFYIFLGPKPENIVQQFTQLVGRPYMPPYWSLGFHLGRWGLFTTDDIRTVVDNMRNAKIPFDVQYSDIEYMDGNKDFTLSLENFADLPQLIQDIHDHGEHFVLLLDPGLANFDPNYYAYNQAMEKDVFIKYPNGTILTGSVWPGDVYYVDYTHDNALAFWAEQCLYLFRNLSLEYDGIWIDMDEVANWYVGSKYGCDRNQWNYPPFCPPILGSEDGKLFDQTICMDTVHHTGHKHYDLHSLYGYYMTKVTFNALLVDFPERRPFVFTRSQFPGTGQYGHHWLGDNDSTFEQLRNSIVAIQEFNMFGIPFIGPDICGFGLNTTEELCLRWMQLGSFYSYSRNHNSIGNIPQDPPSLGPRVVNASIKALTERYRLLPHLYTLLHDAHTAGTTVIRPLFFEYPTDANARNVSFQFLWGSGLLVSPVLYENVTTVDAYFPAAKWYDYYTGVSVGAGSIGTTITLDAPLDGYIPLHVRGGTIIPTQQPEVTTTASRDNPMGLIVGVDEGGKASGRLYWDDGITYEADVKGLFNQFQFSYADNTLDVLVMNNGLAMSTPLDTVVVYGLAVTSVASVTADGIVLSPSQVNYDAVAQVLKLSALGLQLPLNHQIKVISA